MTKQDALDPGAIEVASIAVVDGMEDEDWTELDPQDRAEVRVLVRTAVATYLGAMKRVMDVPGALVAYKAALDEHTTVIQRMRASSTEEHVADYLATLRVIRETRATLEATVRKAA
jgi:hypothetical protein